MIFFFRAFILFIIKRFIYVFKMAVLLKRKFDYFLKHTFTLLLSKDWLLERLLLYNFYLRQHQLLSIGQFLTIVLLHQILDLLTKYKNYIIRSVQWTKEIILIEPLLHFMEVNLKVSLIKASQKLDHWYQLIDFINRLCS